MIIENMQDTSTNHLESLESARSFIDQPSPYAAKHADWWNGPQGAHNNTDMGGADASVATVRDHLIMHGREMETGISVTGQSIYGWYFETWDGAAEEEAGDAHAG
jgi:hypothetical protein